MNTGKTKSSTPEWTAFVEAVNAYAKETSSRPSPSELAYFEGVPVCGCALGGSFLEVDNNFARRKEALLLKVGEAYLKVLPTLTARRVSSKSYKELIAHAPVGFQKAMEKGQPLTAG